MTGDPVVSSRASEGLERMALMKGVTTMRTFVATAAAIVLAVGVSLAAQAKPDFSGRWVMDPSPAAPAGDTGGRGAGGRGAGATGFQPGFGPEITIKHDAKALTITRGQGSPLVYNLDGTDSKNMVTRGGQQQEQIARATWEGNKLVIATEVNFQGNVAEQRRVLSLEGGNLVIDQTNPGRNGGPPIKVVYKKG
jgi:hypothetical protein